MPLLAYFGIESSGLTVAIDLIIVFGVLLYLALIYWTYVDARRRIVDPTVVGCATAVSLFPFVGTLLYVVVRPPETLEDAQERELELETTRLRLHQLESGLCPHCDYPVEPDFVRCPSCLRKLKDRCKGCSRPLDRAWTICPYCETEVAARSTGSRRSGARRGSRARPPLERELAGERSAGPADGRKAPASKTPAATHRRAAQDGTDGQPGVGARRPQPAGTAVDGRDADGRRPDRAEQAAGSRSRAADRPRSSSAPRPGSSY
jgi:hypothetical protein